MQVTVRWIGGSSDFWKNDSHVSLSIEELALNNINYKAIKIVLFQFTPTKNQLTIQSTPHKVLEFW